MCTCLQGQTMSSWGLLRSEKIALDDRLASRKPPVYLPPDAFCDPATPSTGLDTCLVINVYMVVSITHLHLGLDSLVLDFIFVICRC